MEEDTTGDGVESTAEEAAEPDQEAHHELVMAVARRIIPTDAEIIHRLGTV